MKPKISLDTYMLMQAMFYCLKYPNESDSRKYTNDILKLNNVEVERGEDETTEEKRRRLGA